MTTDTELKTYTVCAAYYDSDCRATLTVKARSFEEACETAVGRIDEGSVSTQTYHFGESPTFVYGVVEGDGDPFSGMQNVPHRFLEPTGRPDVTREVAQVIAAAHAAVEAGRPSTLTPTLSRALDALALALAPFPGKTSA